MSVVYEPRAFLSDGEYPSVGDDHADEQHYTDSDVAEHLGQYTAQDSIVHHERHGLPDDVDVDVLAHDDPIIIDDDDEDDTTAVATAAVAANAAAIAAQDAQDTERLGLSPTFSSPMRLSLGPDDGPLEGHDLSPGAASPSSVSRGKPFSKPERDVMKQADGKYHCPLPDCREETNAFSRKCEWNKHMDKHERPYRCPADGCENLPGFTYSGGLLRHEREVHGKHGGPKKTVNCPHVNCKRHTGKGFSRQENLNEHLRRVHTHPESPTPPADTVATPEENEGVIAGVKRKRTRSDAGGDDDGEMQPDELKRLREENAKLKAEVQQLSQDKLTLGAQVVGLQEAVRQGMAQHGPTAPTAQMI